MNIVIAVVWIIFLAAAFVHAIILGLSTRPAVKPFPPVEIALGLWAFSFIFFSAGPFFMRRRIYDMGVTGIPGALIRKVIDWRWGAGTYREFLVRLKPTLLMMFVCLILGTVGLVSTYANDKNWSVYVLSGFALSCGLGLLVGYLLSRRFPPRLS